MKKILESLHEDKAKSKYELKKRIGMYPQTFYRYLDWLEKEEFIETIETDRNRSQIEVRISEKGKQFLGFGGSQNKKSVSWVGVFKVWIKRIPDFGK